MKKIITAIFILLLLQQYLNAGEAENLTLENCERIALENNGEYRAALSELKKARLGYTLAYQMYSPKISLSATYTLSEKLREFEIPPDSPFAQLSRFISGREISSFTIDFTYDYNIEVKLLQPIFNTKILLGIENAYLAKKLAKEKVRQIRNKVIFNVRNLFYTALLLKELIGISEESLKLAEEQLRVTRAKFNVGEATEFEVLRNKVEVSSARVAVIQSKNNYKKVLLALMTTMGREFSEKLTLIGKPNYGEEEEVPLSQKEAIQKGLDERPEMKQLEILKKMKRKEKNFSYYDYSPSLSLVGTYNLYTNSPEKKWLEDYNFLLALNWDIFTGLTRVTKAQMLSRDLQKLNEQGKILKDTIVMQIKEAYLALKEARQMKKAMRDAVKTARKSVEIAKERYRIGLMTSLELMDAQMALKRARAGWMRAVYSYKKALEELKLATGTIGGDL